MANPQLENGHIRIANELFERLMKAGLTGTEWDAIASVIRKSWGYRKKEAPVSLRDFNALTNRDLESIRYAVGTLQKKNILIQTSPATFRTAATWKLNKDWESWILKGEGQSVLNFGESPTAPHSPEVWGEESPQSSGGESPQSSGLCGSELFPQAEHKSTVMGTVTDPKTNIKNNSKKKREGSRSHFVPADFVITDSDREWARGERPDLNVDFETAKFRDHEFKNPRTAWKATWRNWIRNARSIGDGPPTGGGAGSRGPSGNASGSPRSDARNPRSGPRYDPRKIKDDSGNYL